MSTMQIAITIGVVVAGTMLTRFLPYICFPGKRNSSLHNLPGKIPGTCCLRISCCILFAERGIHQGHLRHSRVDRNSRYGNLILVETEHDAVYGPWNDSLHVPGPGRVRLKMTVPRDLIFIDYGPWPSKKGAYSSHCCPGCETSSSFFYFLHFPGAPCAPAFFRPLSNLRSRA